MSLHRDPTEGGASNGGTENGEEGAHIVHNEAPEQAVPRPAATVMLVKDAPAGLLVLMARRSARSAFMPDAYVFPGGAVEPADSDREWLADIDRFPSGVEPAVAIAALRELFEEAGILFVRDATGAAPASHDVVHARQELRAAVTFRRILERHGWQLRTGSLVYYSRWITPPVRVSRRFDTRFFVAAAGDEHVATADAEEMHDGVWIAPAEALRRAQQGEWNIVFPTLRHLERLAQFRSAVALLDHARSRRPRAVMPIVHDGVIELPRELEEW